MGLLEPQEKFISCLQKLRNMNNQRRKDLNAIFCQLQNLQGDLENLLQEEQDYYDNMPENLQGGEKGEASESAINNMEEAISNVEEAISNIEAAVE